MARGCKRGRFLFKRTYSGQQHREASLNLHFSSLCSASVSGSMVLKEEVGGHRGEEEGPITWGSQQLFYSLGDTSEGLGTEEKCDQMLILKGLLCFKNSVNKGVEAGAEVSATELISTCLMFPASTVSVHFAFPPAMYESSLVNTWSYQSLTVAF